MIEQRVAAMRELGDIDVVLSPAMGAVPVGQQVGLALHARTIYSERDFESKQMQLKRGFEIGEGERVLLVEDLTTDGGSKLSFVDAIRETGAECAHTAVIFYYGIFPETIETLSNHGVALHHLCTWWDVLEVARAGGKFDHTTLKEVESFLRAPRAWQEARQK